jgi:hypothetical protein
MDLGVRNYIMRAYSMHGETRNTCTNIVRKPEGRRPLEKLFLK